MRQKELGLWREWTWARTAAAVREIGDGLLALGFGAGRHRLDPRQHGDRMGARRSRRAVGGRGLERHLPDRRRRPGRVPVRRLPHQGDLRRGRRAARQGARGARAPAGAGEDRRLRHRGPARLPRPAGALSRRPARARPRPGEDPSAASSTSVPPPAGPKTWRSWSTPRARPASPRGRCIRTAASSTRSAATTRSSARTRTTSGCASCRCATSPSGSAASTSRSTPARC